MNITTEAHLEQLFADFIDCDVASVDVESNGLSIHAGHFPISISIYFPEFDRSYNFPFAHGEGAVAVAKEVNTDAKFHAINWQRKAKKQYYKRYWFEMFKQKAPSVWDNAWGNVSYSRVEEFRELWNDLIADKRIIYYNAPFDQHMMQLIGFDPPKTAEDVRLLVALTFEDWRYPGLENPRTRAKIEGSDNSLKWQANFWGVEGALDGEHALKDAAHEFTQLLAAYASKHWDDPINATVHKLKRAATQEELEPKLAIDPKSEMWMLPSHVVAPYAENDVVITWKLREKLLPKLETWGQTQLYFDNCAVQNEVSIRMERNGVLLDADLAHEQVEKLEPIKDEIKAWFTERYNPGENHGVKSIQTFAFSSKKIMEAFYGMGIYVEATDKKTLERWEDENGKHEAIQRLLDYRKAQRASSTYLKKWIASRDDNGYIHPSFNLAGTITGRWSSSSGTLGQMGNMQNIPSRRFEVKKAVISPPGWKMGQIDYGQIELRLAAWIAGCQLMIDMFNAGEDLHEYTMHQMDVRGLLFGQRSDEEIVEEVGLSVKVGGSATKAVYTYCRTLAKTCNFALLYRGTYRVLVRMLDIPVEQAQKLHSAWNALYPEFAQANRYYEDQALTRRVRPDGTGATYYVTQPLGGRTRKYELYPTYEVIRDKKTGVILFTQNTRQRKAKDAFNAIVQGQATYIIGMSILRVARKYGDDVLRLWALIHDSVNFYIRADMLHILPDIQHIMTDWDTDPPQTAEVELSETGSWQDLKEVADLGELIAAMQKELGSDVEDEEDDAEQTEDQ